MKLEHDGSEKVIYIEADSISDVLGIFHDEYAGCRLLYVSLTKV